MQEICCEIAYSDDLYEELKHQMDDIGQIKIQGSDDSFVEVMPVDQKNFINEVQPVLSIVLSLGSNLAIGIIGNWLYDKVKDSKVLKLGGRTVKVSSKEDVSKALEEYCDETR